jgi:flagella basal body P-ring formation protein FlgA
MIRSFAMRTALPALALALAAATPLAAQPALPPAQDLGQLEAMVVNSLGAGVGQPGGPMAPIDRRMRLAACPNGVQIDPPSAGAVTVRCTAGAGWRLRVPLRQSGAAFAAATGPGGSLGNAVIRKGDPVELIAQGSA